MTELQSADGREVVQAHSCRPRILLAAVAAGLACTTACTRTEAPAPTPEVKPVKAYGMTLDESATPRQVVYVLLRALADDVTAAQGHDHAKQREAMELVHRLGAYSLIESRLVDVINQGLAAKVDSLGASRDERLFEFTRGWAPIVSHYVRSFEAEPQVAMDRMQEHPEPGGERVRVFYPVCHDPEATDPAQRQEQVLDIELAAERVGPRTYWRVARIAYRPHRRDPDVRPVPAPATATAPAAASGG